MHDRVDVLQRRQIGPVGFPGSLRRMRRGASDEADHSVPTCREVRAQRRSDEARRSGHRNGHEPPAALGRPPMGGEVVRKLVVAIPKSVHE